MSDTGLFRQAVQSYNSGKYAEALRQLESFHDQANFSLPKLQALHERIHYYMALSYQNLNQIAPAKQQFFWVYQNGKDARLRYNSQIALRQLDYYQTHRHYAGQGNVFARDSINRMTLPSEITSGESGQSGFPAFDYDAPQHFTITPLPGRT